MKHPVLHIAPRGKAHGSTVRPESGRGRGGGNAEEPDSKREICPPGYRRRSGDNIRQESSRGCPGSGFQQLCRVRADPLILSAPPLACFSFFYPEKLSKECIYANFAAKKMNFGRCLLIAHNNNMCLAALIKQINNSRV